MEKIIKNFLNKYEKKRFELKTLEEYIIQSLKGVENYNSKGGYIRLYDEMVKLRNKKYIREIKSSLYNGMNPPLKIKWEIIKEEEKERWNKSDILKFSDLLDFSYYSRNKELQTELEWEYIENIYKFLKERKKREWASIEERSLELFYDEKFLKNNKNTIKGKPGILRRLKITNEDLKMKRYGEMFIYWNKGVERIRNIIILENHSTFFAYKRILEKKGKIFSFDADILIYGQGKKIESSFSFLEEIAEISQVKVLYFGDLDSEGLGIYFRLKDRYPAIDIKLQHRAYLNLINISNRNYPLGKQEKNNLYFEKFLEEIGGYLDNNSIYKLKNIWNNNLRIPQELINYEYMLKVK